MCFWWAVPWLCPAPASAPAHVHRRVAVQSIWWSARFRWSTALPKWYAYELHHRFSQHDFHLRLLRVYVLCVRFIFHLRCGPSPNHPWPKIRACRVINIKSGVKRIASGWMDCWLVGGGKKVAVEAFPFLLNSPQWLVKRCSWLTGRERNERRKESTGVVIHSHTHQNNMWVFPPDQMVHGNSISTNIGFIIAGKFWDLCFALHQCSVWSGVACFEQLITFSGREKTERARERGGATCTGTCSCYYGNHS